MLEPREGEGFLECLAFSDCGQRRDNGEVKSEGSGHEGKPVRMVRVLRDASDDDGTFDLDFWREVGAEGRLGG